MRHPYIVTYRESFMDKRCLCIVMDYADGGDMYSKIAKQKQLGKGFPENLLLDWFVQICLAIKHIHDRKILHRDLKTQNVFLTAKGEVKIGDFGISRVLQHTYDCAQTAIGTPYYLSPEICQEKPYNQKSDIWSLGCILYEMVTLRHAFDASSMKGLVVKILRGTYPSIPSVYSQNLKDLIDEMLQKDPHKRPSIKRILEKDFLSSRIPDILALTISKHESEKSTIPREPQSEEKQDSIKDPQISLSRDSRNEESSRPHTPLEERKKERILQPRNRSESSEEKKRASREQSRYEDIINCLREGLEINHNEEEESFEENQPAKANFLTPEGVPLPGISENDSAFARIETLRCYLESRIGMSRFIQAYEYLSNPPPEDEENQQLHEIVGAENVKFIPLIYQMIVCEDSYYTSANSR